MVRLLIGVVIACLGSFALAAAPQVEGMKLVQARAKILKAGWKPRETHLHFGEIPERERANAAIFFKAGFREVEVCAGTGVNPCIFNYSRGAECLRVYTIGEQPKHTVVQSVTEECPADEAR